MDLVWQGRWFHVFLLILVITPWLPGLLPPTPFVVTSCGMDLNHTPNNSPFESQRYLPDPTHASMIALLAKEQSHFINVFPRALPWYSSQTSRPLKIKALCFFTIGTDYPVKGCNIPEK
jgi:hypothetical protein